MQQRTKGLLVKGNPLGTTTPWPIIIGEGLLLLGLGIYILVDKEGAGSTILDVISLVLLVASIVGIVTELRTRSTRQVLSGSLHAGIGLTVGTIGTARWIWDYMDDRPLRLILGWGLLAYAVLHIAGILMTRGDSGIAWGSLGISLFTLILGIVLLVNDDTNSTGTLNLLAALFIVFGLLLVGLGYLRYQSAQNASTA